MNEAALRAVIQGLLAKTVERGATPHEAAAAAAKAQELLLRHGLSETEALGPADAPAIESHTEEFATCAGWRRQTSFKALLTGVSIHLGCEVLLGIVDRRSGLVVSARFFGRPTNVALAVWLAQKLIAELPAAAEQHWLVMRGALEQRTPRARLSKSQFVRSFLGDAVLTICARIERARRAALEAAERATQGAAGALVVQTARQIEEAIRRAAPTAQSLRLRHPAGGPGSEAGQRFGRDVSLGVNGIGRDAAPAAAIEARPEQPTPI